MKIMKSLYQSFGKRIFDLFLSLLVLFLMWPFFIIIGFLIKISSSGPIIFKQKRIGRGGKIFILYKFRTMVKDAEKIKKKYQHLNEADGPVFKITNDPRFFNGLGKFLSHTGIDELPNLFNVLKGELSWVGPRPLPVEEAKKIEPHIRKIRESVLPGITSWWVVNGSHQLTFKQWMNLDKKYINNISFAEDIKILIKTFLLVLKLLKNRLF